MILAGVLALVAGILIARALVLSVTRPITSVIETFRSLANGDYTRNVDIARNDEMGKVLQGLQSMQIQQGFNVAEAARIGEENLRIKIGLDCVSSPVRIADLDGRIIYANKALLAAVGEMEDSCGPISRVSVPTSWSVAMSVCSTGKVVRRPSPS
jgi:methyl-accepting chemotaxis protein